MVAHLGRCSADLTSVCCAADSSAICSAWVPHAFDTIHQHALMSFDHYCLSSPATLVCKATTHTLPPDALHTPPDLQLAPFCPCSPLQRWYGRDPTSPANHTGYRATATIDALAAAAAAAAASSGSSEQDSQQGVGWLRLWSAEAPVYFLLGVALVEASGRVVQAEVVQVRTALWGRRGSHLSFHQHAGF
jgi:hypothetical protein